ncbi:unnamed protein product, partial [Protopolystoma xenopodis]
MVSDLKSQNYGIPGRRNAASRSPSHPSRRTTDSQVSYGQQHRKTASSMDAVGTQDKASDMRPDAAVITSQLPEVSPTGDWSMAPGNPRHLSTLFSCASSALPSPRASSPSSASSPKGTIQSLPYNCVTGLLTAGSMGKCKSPPESSQLTTTSVDNGNWNPVPKQIELGGYAQSFQRTWQPHNEAVAAQEAHDCDVINMHSAHPDAYRGTLDHAGRGRDGRRRYTNSYENLDDDGAPKCGKRPVDTCLLSSNFRYDDQQEDNLLMSPLMPSAEGIRNLHLEGSRYTECCLGETRQTPEAPEQHSSSMTSITAHSTASDEGDFRLSSQKTGHDGFESETGSTVANSSVSQISCLEEETDMEEKEDQRGGLNEECPSKENGDGPIGCTTIGD